jgi:hypothetical protein
MSTEEKLLSLVGTIYIVMAFSSFDMASIGSVPLNQNVERSNIAPADLPQKNGK